MGRIHRIGQTRDVHIFNLVATNTREGYALLDCMQEIIGLPVLTPDDRRKALLPQRDVATTAT